MRFHRALDPHDLVGPLEQIFGSLFFYRMPGPAGARRFLLASLADAWVVRRDGVHRHGTVLPLALAEVFQRAGTVEGHDGHADPLLGSVVFATSYDLTASTPTTEGGRSPLAVVARVDTCVIWDESSHTLSAYGLTASQAADLSTVVDRLPAPRPPQPTSGVLGRVAVALDEAHHRDGVKRARDACARGEVTQVIVSARMSITPTLNTPDYFAEVVRRYPTADFAYWLSLPGVRLLGTCSLPHLMVAGGEVTARVVAGTQPVPATAPPDGRYRLVEDPGRFFGEPGSKYHAEHLALVDAELDALGSICRPGSITTEELLRPTVVGPTLYLTSLVRGTLAEGLGPAALLLATAPRGTVVGAPRRPAIELIAELEGEPRGFYTGVIGVYSGATGSLVSNAIVTCAQADGDDLMLRVGSGVTDESTPEQELAELRTKLRYLV